MITNTCMFIWKATTTYYSSHEFVFSSDNAGTNYVCCVSVAITLILSMNQ